MRPKILVDSDGVLDDFVSDVIDLVNADLKTKHTYTNATQWDLYKALGVSEERGKHYDMLIRKENFCYDLREIPGARKGLEELRTVGDVVCVTAPFPKSRYWHYERQVWLEFHMGFQEKQVIFAHDKASVAGTYLIDDKITNLEAWAKESYNGTPILFNQPWNKEGWSGYRAFGWEHLVAMIRSLETGQEAWGVGKMSRCYGCSQENCDYGPCSCCCHRQNTWTTTSTSIWITLPDKCPCKKHRRYQAKRKPTTGCEACWRHYVKVNP